MRRGRCLCKGRAGRDLDLAEEPVGTERRAELGLKHLQSHPAAMLQIFGEVDGSHAAATELALDPVATAQALETIEWSKTDSSVAERRPTSTSGTPTQRTNAPPPRQATAQAAGQPDLVVDCSADLPKGIWSEVDLEANTSPPADAEVLVLATGNVVQRVDRCTLFHDGVGPISVAEALLRPD